MNNNNGHLKLVFWILGFLGTVVLALGGLLAAHEIGQSDRMENSLSIIEAQEATLTQRSNDVERRLERIEEKLDQIQKQTR